MRTNLEGKVEIKAVHDDDLSEFLEKLGMSEEINNGRIHCTFCNCIINTSNFGGVFKENGNIKSFCQKTECYLEVLKRKNLEKQMDR